MSNIEINVWKEIAGLNLSPSHDRWHVDRVLEFARQLQEIHEGDLEVITAAVILHDLGRSDPSLHGEDSIQASINQAKRILEKIAFPPDKAEKVILAVQEHDNPDVTPSSIEGRILKDADFLAGFGAWGILRIALWAGETGGGVDQIMDRLENRMPKRLENLEFPESERWARKEMSFVRLFLASMREEPTLPKTPRKGKYIVLEGNSGSGKDTQAEILKEHLEQLGKKVVVVSEPGDHYKAIRDLLQDKYKKPLDDPMLRRFILMADRFELVRERVRPALERGDVVISVRSFISTMVYQCENALDVADVAYMHNFVPSPDILILYDIDTDTAIKRIEDRTKIKGGFENRDDLIRHRKRYLQICQSDIIIFPTIIIEAAKSIDSVSAETWQAVKGNILSN